jgi:dTMP kinase
LFITFEGPDKAGKTTQVKLLQKYAEENNLGWFFTRNPGETDLGQRLRSIVLDSEEKISDKAELMIYLADRAHFVHEVLQPKLAEGQTVVCDRFNDSTIAYQGFGRGIDAKTIDKVCHLVCEGIKPDLTILLMVSHDEAEKRRKDAKKDRLEAQNKLFFVRVRNGYKILANEDPKRFRMIQVDGLSVEEVHQKIIAVVNEKIQELQTEKLKT